MSHGFYNELYELRYLCFIIKVNNLQICWEKLNVHDKYDFK